MLNQRKAKKSSKSKVAPIVRVGRRQRRASRRPPVAASENTYLLSLQDPQEYPGAKIPDLVSLPSSTCQTEEYGILTSNAAGDLAMVVVPRITNEYWVQNSATTTWTWVGTQANNSQLTSFVNLFEGVRPVSMKVRLDFIGSTANDQGSVGACLQARPTSGLAGANEYGAYPTTFAALLQSENSYVAAARDGIEIIWVPEDALDLSYSNPQASSYASASTTYNDKLQSTVLPYVVVAGTGLAVSTASFRYTITINWEMVARVSTIAFVHSEPSPVNLGFLQQAFNWAQQNFGKFARMASNAAPYVQNAINGVNAARALGAGTGGMGMLPPLVKALAGTNQQRLLLADAMSNNFPLF